MAVRLAARTDRLGAEQIANVQRARILSAMAQEACERGAANVSVANVVKRSGVSRRTFYDMFGDREDCFAASFEQALALAGERANAAYEPGAPWRVRLRAGLIALLSFLDEEPRLGRLLIVESLAAGPSVAARRAAIVAQLTRLVDEGRLQTAKVSEPPPLTAEGVVGAVLSLLQARLAATEHPPLLGLANELMSMIVLPYQGASAASRELTRAVPALDSIERGRQPLRFDPFKAAGLRLTYRTVRVLMAVVDHPGASNRVIADTAEINDGGQISKLLRRLERAALVTNDQSDCGGGAPNAWTLTSTGRQAVESIREHQPGDASPRWLANKQTASMGGSSSVS